MRKSKAMAERYLKSETIRVLRKDHDNREDQAVVEPHEGQRVAMGDLPNRIVHRAGGQNQPLEDNEIQLAEVDVAVEPREKERADVGDLQHRIVDRGLIRMNLGGILITNLLRLIPMGG